LDARGGPLGPPQHHGPRPPAFPQGPGPGSSTTRSSQPLCSVDSGPCRAASSGKIRPVFWVPTGHQPGWVLVRPLVTKNCPCISGAVGVRAPTGEGLGARRSKGRGLPARGGVLALWSGAWVIEQGGSRGWNWGNVVREAVGSPTGVVPGGPLRRSRCALTNAFGRWGGQRGGGPPGRVWRVRPASGCGAAAGRRG